MPVCSDCNEDKPREQFNSDVRRKFGHFPHCKGCCSVRQKQQRSKHSAKYNKQRREKRQQNPEYAKAVRSRWYYLNKTKVLDYILKKKFGFPAGTYDALLAAQNGQCAVCHTTTPKGPGRFHVDHCHDTNKIRGLLCHNCNVGIGNLKHSEVILRSAIDYLNRTKN